MTINYQSFDGSVNATFQIPSDEFRIINAITTALSAHGFRLLSTVGDATDPSSLKTAATFPVINIPTATVQPATAAIAPATAAPSK